MFLPALFGALGGLMSGVGSAAGGAISSAGQANAQASANKANKEMARDQMNFQAHMSNTAYQRQREDMEKAGLNPILAANAGGASTPSGAMSQANPVNTADATGKLVSGLSGSAIQAAQTAVDLKDRQATVALKEAQTLDTATSAKAKEINLPATESESKFRKKRADVDSSMAEVDGAVSRIIKGIGGVTDAVSLRRLIQGKFTGSRSNGPGRGR